MERRDEIFSISHLRLANKGNFFNSTSSSYLLSLSKSNDFVLAKRDLRADYSIGGRKKVVRHPKRLDLIIAPVAKFTAFIYRAK